MSHVPPLPPPLASITHAGDHDANRELYHGSFTAKVQRFMVTNVEAFNDLAEEVTLDPLQDSEVLAPHKESCLYGNPLPIEYLMQVPIQERQKRLLQLISPGDIVRGHVILKAPISLGVRITSFILDHKVREVSQLDIRGLVHLENLDADKSKWDGVLAEMREDDVVYGVVISKQDSLVNMSFNTEHVSQFCPSGRLPEGVHLGYQEGERPIHPKERPESVSIFLSQLEESMGFTNPGSTHNLKALLGIRGHDSGWRPTLIDVIRRANYPISDYGHALRKVQRHKWSMDTVAVGVKHFKNGDLDRAMKLFDHALDIDPCNVEGLVARGALYANNRRYKEAITGFEAALTLHHTHKNARKYLVETQIAYGQELEKEGKIERAVVCYREALADDPSQTSAKERLNILMAFLKRKAAEKMEKERIEAAEKARLKRLHSIIEEEKEKKKTKGRKKNKRKGKTEKKKKKKSDLKRGSKYEQSKDESSTDTEYSSPSTSSRTHSRASRQSLPSRSHKEENRLRSSSNSPSDLKRHSKSSKLLPTSLDSSNMLSSSHSGSKDWRRHSKSPKSGSYSRAHCRGGNSDSPPSSKGKYSPPRSGGRRRHSNSSSSSPPRSKGVRRYSRSRSRSRPRHRDRLRSPVRSRGERSDCYTRTALRTSKK